MKKIIISTFNNSNNNYGAVFQSCGLGAFLKEMSYEPYFLTLKKRNQKSINNTIKFKRAVKSILQIPIKGKVRRRKQGFSDFINDTQRQIIYEDVDSLFTNPPYADVYLSGSDQVWNPLNIHEDLFLGYVDKDSKKISYAASMGNEIIPLNNQKLFADYISKYEYISVREDTMVDIISMYTNKMVNHNVDPVFLMSCEEWKKLEAVYKNLNYDRYILVYVIEWTREFENKLKVLKEETGIPVVAISLGNIKKICADQIIYDASPNEFLYLINNAEMVVTTSFHGTALSIIYNKKFISLVGKDKPTRIESMLRHFSLLERTKLEKMTDVIDYDCVNAVINRDKEIAKNYLQKAIEG